MRSLQEAVGRQLQWKPRSLLSRTHDLVDPETSEGEPYATLLWRSGFMGFVTQGPVEAESGDGRWVFRRRGFFRERVLVMAEDGATQLAAFQRYWRRGVLRLEGGRQFTWRRESFLSPTWRFEDGNGTAVVRFRTRFSFPRSLTQIEIEASAAAAADRALLACLGCYLLVLARRRSAAHGVR
jgi:hypothetical protein